MASKSHDLTHGPLVQQIILFSLPLMATNVLQVLFNMSDVAVVGQFAGPEALGSVGSTSILVSLFTGFLIGMGSGINVVVARYIGARHDQDVHEAVHTSLILSLIVGVIIMALGFLFTPAMLSMLGTKPVLMAGAVSYLRIYCLGMPAMAVFNFGNAVLSAAGDTKKPLYFLSMAGVINILLNLFFVIVCHLAAAGVALGCLGTGADGSALAAQTKADSEDVKKIENYLNSIKTMRADFVQIASNGEKVEGRLYIEKPNKIRMEYNAPSNVLIVGNGDYIVYYDKELDQITNIDYEDIPAAAILANTVKIDGKELKVTNFYEDPGVMRVGLQYANAGDLGPFTLVFANNPFELRQWKVVTPQAMEVSLSLYDTVVDGKLDEGLFKFRKSGESGGRDRFKRK